MRVELFFVAAAASAAVIIILRLTDLMKL